MTADDPVRGPGLHPGWRTVAELERDAETTGPNEVDAWMAAISGSVGLPASLVEKLQRSAGEAVARVARATGRTSIRFVRLCIFVPARLHGDKTCWGFFRIERVEHLHAPAKPVHVIEFFLYQEGS